MILAVASLITMGGDDIDRCVEDSGSGFEIINKNLGQINMNLERIRQISGVRGTVVGMRREWRRALNRATGGKC